MNRRTALLLGASVGSTLVFACAQKGEPSDEPKAPKKKAPATDKPASAAAPPKAPAGKKVTVKVGVGDQLAYSTKRIEVTAGSTVELTITHKGKMGKEVMGHNFVLLKQGTDMTKFASAAMTAMATAYIPAAMKDQVIAHTKVVGGGESDTISFPAPAPGEYVFVCSFPGHASVMNGKFVVI